LFEQLSILSGTVCSAEVQINVLQISKGRLLGHDCVIFLDF